VFRARSIVSDLGIEKQCLACCEYWPSDIEFFEARNASRDRLSVRCIACTKEKRWTEIPAARLALP
jgi:hypothetical protein